MNSTQLDMFISHLRSELELFNERELLIKDVAENAADYSKEEIISRIDKICDYTLDAQRLIAKNNELRNPPKKSFIARLLKK